mmetsp:Transcript_38483/g.83735  ORF Transcript_38483/g.83735 Transcript_38483/m.83735 type:complete len:274 (-) Transcript_38483:664-1485(-)
MKALIFPWASASSVCCCSYSASAPSSPSLLSAAWSLSSTMTPLAFFRFWFSTSDVISASEYLLYCGMAPLRRSALAASEAGVCLLAISDRSRRCAASLASSTDASAGASWCPSSRRRSGEAPRERPASATTVTPSGSALPRAARVAARLAAAAAVLAALPAAFSAFSSAMMRSTFSRVLSTSASMSAWLMFLYCGMAPFSPALTASETGVCLPDISALSRCCDASLASSRGEPEDFAAVLIPAVLLLRLLFFLLSCFTMPSSISEVNEVGADL